MGISIVAAVEYLAYPDRQDPWCTLTHNVSLLRHYDLFYRMGYAVEDPLHPPRGAPADADDDTRVMLEECNGISPSWLTTQEFRTALEGVDARPEYWATLAAMEEFERRGLRARLVFAFD